MNSSAPTRGVRSSEDGYALLAVMFLLVLLVLSLSIAVPRMAKEIQRDREVEAIERGKQYIRAVQLYYKKFHAYPPNVDALVNTNEIRFLRKRYTDPMTGKDDWKPILYCQNKVPAVFGFFGQPLPASCTAAGTGPSGGTGVNGAASGSPFSISGVGSSPSTTTGTTGAASSTNPTDSGNSTTAASSTTSTFGTTGTSTGSSSATGTSATGSSSASGQTFGGAGIVGFSPGADKPSIITYKTKNRYNEWEFTYDPAMDMKTVSGGNAGAIGQPASSTSTPIGNSGFGSSPFGSPTTTTGTGTTNTPNTPTGTVPQQ